jgi:ketosteroid isomerase-like protein
MPIGANPTEEHRGGYLGGMADSDIQAVQRIYTALTRWDIDDMVADVTHDIEMTLPDPLPWGGTHHGPEGVRSFARIFRDHVEGPWADPDDFLEAGDRIVVLGRLRGRAREGGQEFEVGFVHVWTLTDGIASRAQIYYDSAPILAALDGRPPPEPPPRI